MPASQVSETPSNDPTNVPWPLTEASDPLRPTRIHVALPC
jgi:hypothetical protein